MRIGRIEQAWDAEALRPAVGWKVWRIEDGLLKSVLYGDPWPTDDAIHASCARHGHEAPSALCECGIHAGRDLAAWEHYLRVGRESRVFGRVLLWGSTVEGEQGWRAACARPVEIFVPSAVTEPVEGLEGYGVPVHLPAREVVAA